MSKKEMRFIKSLGFLGNSILLVTSSFVLLVICLLFYPVVYSKIHNCESNINIVPVGSCEYFYYQKYKKNFMGSGFEEFVVNHNFKNKWYEDNGKVCVTKIPKSPSFLMFSLPVVEVCSVDGVRIDEFKVFLED